MPVDAIVFFRNGSSKTNPVPAAKLFASSKRILPAKSSVPTPDPSFKVAITGSIAVAVTTAIGALSSIGTNSRVGLLVAPVKRIGLPFAKVIKPGPVRV